MNNNNRPIDILILVEDIRVNEGGLDGKSNASVISFSNDSRQKNGNHTALNSNGLKCIN